MYLLWLLEVERGRAAAGPFAPGPVPSRLVRHYLVQVGSQKARVHSGLFHALALRKTDADLDRDQYDCSDAAAPKSAFLTTPPTPVNCQRHSRTHAVRYSRHDRRHVERMYLHTKTSTLLKPSEAQHPNNRLIICTEE